MKKNLLILIISIYIIFSLTPYSLCDDLDTEVIDVTSEITSSTTSSTVKIPETNSRSCVIIDRKTNIILYGKNETTKRKMASTTKIMTALIIIENYDLNETVEISKKAASTGGSRLGLKTGDKITVMDLLYGLMLCSGNDDSVT